MATYALIPGAGGDPWEWHRLIPELASRGHHAIAVRLPAEDDTAGWSEYADAVVDAIADRSDVILVAASMAGFTAPIVCARRRIDILVLLNAMIPLPGETFNTWGSNTGSGPARAEYHASLGLSRVDAEDDTAGWSGYADAVVDAIADPSDVILVAASMAGFTAPIVCARRRVDFLVLLNAMIPLPGETFNTWGSNTGSGPARAEYHASLGLSPVDTEDDAVIYYHDLAPDLRAEAQARTWQNQSMTPLDEPWPLAAWPDVTTRVLAGRHDRMFPLDFQQRVSRDRLGIEPLAVDGGHMVALSNPAVLADRLEAFRLEVQGRGRDV